MDVIYDPAPRKVGAVIDGVVATSIALEHSAAVSTVV